MSVAETSFIKHITSRENKTLLWLTTGISILYFIILRSIYPLPSFCGDSYTYIGTARYDYLVGYRPILYSKYINFFHLFSKSDIALIASQFTSNIISNLFLFFTCTWFFKFNKITKYLLYILLICNPFYLFYSNYITSDPFFNCFTVLWFTLLIWMINNSSWYIILAQFIVFSQLFLIRYNAVIFPFFLWMVVFLGKFSMLKRLVSISASIMVIVAFVYINSYLNYKKTGTRTFTAFSGWQLANNAMHVVRHKTINTSDISDQQVKHLVMYSKNFFDTTKEYIPGYASSWYMWYHMSPLKQYIKDYEGRSKYFFRTWSALGPVYSKLGRTIILQNPGAYVRYFILPNTKEYIFPRMEIYKNYFEHVDTIGLIARQFYGYNQTKITTKKQVVYDVVFTPWRYLFPLVNFIFISLLIWYVYKKKYMEQSKIFNYTLLIFSLLFIANFFFIVILAPSVFRYHIFIITIGYPIILLLLQQFKFREKNTVA